MGGCPEGVGPAVGVVVGADAAGDGEGGGRCWGGCYCGSGVEHLDSVSAGGGSVGEDGADLFNPQVGVLFLHQGDGAGHVRGCH